MESESHAVCIEVVHWNSADAAADMFDETVAETNRVASTASATTSCSSRNGGRTVGRCGVMRGRSGGPAGDVVGAAEVVIGTSPAGMPVQSMIPENPLSGGTGGVPTE